MAARINNRDLVLKVIHTDAIKDIVNKYDTYLEALYDDDYSFHRNAVKEAIAFLLSDRYHNQKELAKENYKVNPKLRELHGGEDDFLSKLHLPELKACSFDLATGTGKSYLMYGIAMVMLCEEAVDKVLVLCPSLTIEEGLKDKFNELNSRKELLDILRSINPNFVQPEIKNANETILKNDICIENIHATYDRTGSSIEASFKNKDHSVLVLNDEAHHIYSGELDTKTKKWEDFLKSKEYNFKYIVGVTGTPYYKSDNQDYFYDLVYRFSLKQATDRGIVKKVDYKTFDEYKGNKGYQQSYEIHKKNIEEYGSYVKPISIVVCADIADAIIEWDNLVKFLMRKENLSKEEAEKKCIWVTSGLPSNDNEKARIKKIISDGADSIRKKNLQLLKEVDEKDNPVEWIVSVSMLTEGWDVKNVFLIIPHEARAFNSRLLISQVLGRGLRMPPAVKQALGAEKVLLRVNNHEAWSEDIKKIYEEILEIENRLSWGYDASRKQYSFPLYNLIYEPVVTAVETKKKEAAMPKEFGFVPQQKISSYKAEYSAGSIISYVYEDQEGYSLDFAAIEINTYLKEKDEKLATKYSVPELKKQFEKELKKKQYDTSYLSRENFTKAQTAFGPLFRELGKAVPRVSNKPDALIEIKLEKFNRQSFSEESLKAHGLFIYTENTGSTYTGEEKQTFSRFTSTDEEIEKVKKQIIEPGADIQELASKLSDLDKLKSSLSECIVKKEQDKLKTPFNAIYVSYSPEKEFIKALLINIDLFDAFIKNADNGFYHFPYSFKPEGRSKTHVKHLQFNPDFFLKLKGVDDIIVIETKKADDDSQKNKAKQRDALEHFKQLNAALEKKGIKQRYYFKFLSDDGNDIVQFFNTVKDKTYKSWKSGLMLQLQA
ncbi:MAG TPA: DEAD/DEAH box helicase family protein [Flavisolibacter sp.]|jgi:type III restriction enzyme|nr:DEAD/DEAH box helicase family protein [Flavisolibacter sp.]